MKLVAILALIAPLAHAAPACWPSTVGGTGTRPVVGVTANGGFTGWWCWTGAEWKLDYVLALPGFVLKHPDPVPADPIQAADAYWTLWSQPSTPAFDPLRADMLAALNAAKPAAPPASAPEPTQTWKVAVNSTYPTRPAYRVVNGALVADSQRATVGNVCDCAALKFVQGTSTYCQPAPLVGVVALCRQY